MKITHTTFDKLHPNTKRALPTPDRQTAHVFTARNSTGKLAGAAVAQSVTTLDGQRILWVDYSFGTDETTKDMLLSQVKSELAYLKRRVLSV